MARWEEERATFLGQAVKTEISVRPDLDLTLIAAHWGEKKIQTPEIQKSTGFPVLFQDSSGTTMEERREQSLDTVVETIVRTIQLHGWRPETIRKLQLACTNPPDGKFLRDVVINSGLSHLDWRNDIELTSLACNSGIRALQKALCDGESVPTIIAAIDDMTGRTKGIESADPLSWQVFSNGVAVLALVPGESLSPIAGNELVLFPDVGGALAIRVIPHEDSSSDHFVGQHVRKRGLEYVVMPKPKQQGRIIDMSGPATAKLFVRLVATYAPEFLNKLDLAQVSSTRSQVDGS